MFVVTLLTPHLSSVPSSFLRGMKGSITLKGRPSVRMLFFVDKRCGLGPRETTTTLSVSMSQHLFGCEQRENLYSDTAPQTGLRLVEVSHLFSVFFCDPFELSTR